MSRTDVAIPGILNIVNDRKWAHPGHNPSYLFYTSRLNTGCLKISVHFRGLKVSCPVSNCYCIRSHISYRFIVTSVSQYYVSTLRCLKLHHALLSGEVTPTPALGYVSQCNGVCSFPQTAFEGNLWTRVWAQVCTSNTSAFGEINLTLNSLHQFFIVF